eukprot:GHVU01177038.1.p1 GENE.GHVU01177038.1~~GHVU01177038.1.p1  ORF type:complete len:232 (+),score=28.58 GHVU01177038.1:279-974(+)
MEGRTVIEEKKRNCCCNSACLLFANALFCSGALVVILLLGFTAIDFARGGLCPRLWRSYHTKGNDVSQPLIHASDLYYAPLTLLGTGTKAFVSLAISTESGGWSEHLYSINSIEDIYEDTRTRKINLSLGHQLELNENTATWSGEDGDQRVEDLPMPMIEREQMMYEREKMLPESFPEDSLFCPSCGIFSPDTDDESVWMWLTRKPWVSHNDHHHHDEKEKENKKRKEKYE